MCLIGAIRRGVAKTDRGSISTGPDWRRCATLAPRQVDNALDPVPHAIGGNGFRGPERPAVRALDPARELLLQHAEHLVLADGGNIEVAEDRVGVSLQRIDELGSVMCAAPPRLQRGMAEQGCLPERHPLGFCGLLRRAVLALEFERVNVAGDPLPLLSCLLTRGGEREVASRAQPHVGHFLVALIPQQPSRARPVLDDEHQPFHPARARVGMPSRRTSAQQVPDLPRRQFHVLVLPFSTAFPTVGRKPPHRHPHSQDRGSQRSISDVSGQK